MALVKSCGENFLEFPALPLSMVNADDKSSTTTT